MPRAALVALSLSLGLWMVSVSPAEAEDACHIPAPARAFMDRALARLDQVTGSPFAFAAWNTEGRVTKEGIGVRTFPEGVDPEKVVQKVLDVDNYEANLDHVTVSRAVPDPKYRMPSAVRFYELIDLSALGDIQFEAVLQDAGTCKGYRVVVWYMLPEATAALSRDVAIRNAYNDGAWLASPTSIGYALSSAPVDEDLNFVQRQALTNGADAMAKSLVQNNIQLMHAWTKK